MIKQPMNDLAKVHFMYFCTELCYYCCYKPVGFKFKELQVCCFAIQFNFDIQVVGGALLSILQLGRVLAALHLRLELEELDAGDRSGDKEFKFFSGSRCLQRECSVVEFHDLENKNL